MKIIFIFCKIKQNLNCIITLSMIKYPLKGKGGEYSIMNIKVNMKFQCKNCNELINHNYTQQDILKLDKLEFTCQKCNAKETIKTSYIIEKAKEEVINEIKKNFKKI